jgi:hypothetical protein
VLRIEPLRVSTPMGFNPLRKHDSAGCAGSLTKAAHPVAGDRRLADGRRGYATAV